MLSYNILVTFNTVTRMQDLFSKKTFYVLLMLAGMGRAKAITYYISANGNDNAAGTSANTAWQTISKLNGQNLLPGTVVLFEGGAIFTGSIQLDAADANDAANPVLISSYGNGKAIIRSGAGMGLYAFNTKGFKVSDLVFEGSGISTNNTDGVKIHTNLGGTIKLENIRITNVEIRQYGVTGLYVFSSNYNTGFKDLLVDSVHIHHVKENGLFIKGYTSSTDTGWSHQDVMIRNCEVDNVPGYADPNSHRGSGIIMAQVDSGSIENCVAHHNGGANTHCGGPGGIWAYDCNHVIIQHCESYRNSSGSGCDGLGFDLDGGMVNSVLQYNYSHDNDGAGYLLGQYDNARPWSNNVVRYNISENDGRTNSGGITLFKGPNSSMNGCKIYHNTVFISASTTNSGAGAFTITDWNTGINGIEVYNNIFQTSGGAYLVNVPLGYNAVFAGNLYWSSGSAFRIRYQGIDHTTLSAWRGASGNEQLGSTLTGLTADPLLTNTAAGVIAWPAAPSTLNGYMTSPGSPATNAGLNLGSLFSINSGAIDFFNSSLTPSNPDIGAYENPASVTTLLEENSSAERISYYPNPINAGDDLYFSGGVSPYAVELTDMNGAIIAKEIVPGSLYHIPEGWLPGGLYIIRVTDRKNRITSGKIVIY